MPRNYLAYLHSGTLALVTVLACPARAGDVASEFGLGTIEGYESETSAQAHCAGDGIVWADRRTGFYYPKFTSRYGVGTTGSFTCAKQAKKADYWGFGTADSLESRRGRVFPFYPEAECFWVVDKTGHGFCGSSGT